MKKLILLSLLLFCIASTPEKRAIILAGQSNMGKSAANIVIMMPDYRVINCAVGGTSITEWQPGAEPYENCLIKVERIKADGYTIDGIFFYHGERDSNDPVISRQWKRLFHRFVNHFRVDADTKAPVIFAQLGPRPYPYVRDYWSVVKNQQRLSEDETKFMYMIPMGDIVPYCPADGVHFCPDGYVEIATRFVNRFAEVVK